MTDPSYTSPQWDRSALLLIDVQNDFIEPDGALPVAGTRELLPAMASVVAAFRSAGRPIVHIVRLYQPHSSDTDLPRRAAVQDGAQIVAPGTRGSQIAPSLLAGKLDLQPDHLLSGRAQVIGPDEIVVYKPRWSAFHRTNLDAWLRERDASTVVVAGCNLPNCPRATLFDASNRDYRTVLVTDATSQGTPERLADLRLIGTHLVTTQHVMNALRARPRGAR